MNIHHLELFFYVAKFGGISEAVRRMPYGIQQPAVSGQILQLEDDLGVKLFNRRPFNLTPAGEKLNAFIKPFFENLSSMADELRSGEAQRIRIGAPENVFRDHLPAVFALMRQKFPGLKLSLRSGYQPQMESWLEQQLIDLAITVLETSPPAGLNSLMLTKLPLVLLVHKRSGLTNAELLWKQDKIEEPLISLPPTETSSRHFQEGLARLGVDWVPSIEASSLEMIVTYVVNGCGIGLTVDVPGMPLHAKLRRIPLSGFKPVEVGLLWQKEPTPLVQAFLDEIKLRAQSLVQPNPVS